MAKMVKLIEWAALDSHLQVRGKSLFCSACEKLISSDQKGHVKQVCRFILLLNKI